MGRLTFDIPDSAHQVLKVLAANQGVTIREFVFSRIAGEIEQAGGSESRLQAEMEQWEKTRGELQLKRNGRSLRDVVHEGHKW